MFVLVWETYFNLYMCFFKQMKILSGLQLWLDAADESTITKEQTSNGDYNVSEWRSKDVTKRVLNVESTYGAFTGVPPVFHPENKGSPPSIEFDFYRTMRINKPLMNIQTIISVHKYKDRYYFFDGLLYYYLFLTILFCHCYKLVLVLPTRQPISIS